MAANQNKGSSKKCNMFNEEVGCKLIVILWLPFMIFSTYLLAGYIFSSLPCANRRAFEWEGLVAIINWFLNTYAFPVKFLVFFFLNLNWDKEIMNYTAYEKLLSTSWCQAHFVLVMIFVRSQPEHVGRYSHIEYWITDDEYLVATMEVDGKIRLKVII